ncbi:hypothetical protein [Streptomyces hainanensis]|uniref:Uncharacterized protein n=1 Tax=Streptomyces hainanensis TaxID=402648 RepID=A0A4R4TIB3_9ACTN|nr:hypothetical protein [Streptomyces hainanensis]TDC77548.1 hypothetical protein E1283_06985 [Streptomyces hainanensis]
MARLIVRTGADPDEPHVPVVMLVVDPEGSPGERAVARLGGHGYEGDGAFYLPRTDGWAERALGGGRLVVDVVVWPAVLPRIGVDAASFRRRSEVVPEAALVLRAVAEVDPAAYARAAPATAVFTAGPGRALDAGFPAADDWPLLLAPPPEE